jgi:hypothetical protein
LTKKVARVFEAKPIYILLLNTVVLLSAGLVTLFPMPEYNRTFRNYQLIGLELVKEGEKVRVIDLDSQRLIYKLERKEGYYQLKPSNRYKTSSSVEIVGDLSANQLSILQREDFTGEIVAQSKDSSDSTTTIRYFLAKRR